MTPVDRRGSLLMLAVGWVVAAASWVTALVILQESGFRTGNLLRDVAEVGRVPALSGFFSTLGVVGWGIAVGALVTATCVVRGKKASGSAIYPLVTAGLTLGLALDDAFLVHEVLAPRRANIDEQVVLAAYAVAAVGWALSFRSRWDAAAWLLLGLSVLAFTGSVAVDLVSNTGILYEDAAKYLGLWTFAAFAIRESVRCVNGVVRS